LLSIFYYKGNKRIILSLKAQKNMRNRSKVKIINNNKEATGHKLPAVVRRGLKKEWQIACRLRKTGYLTIFYVKY